MAAKLSVPNATLSNLPVPPPARGMSGIVQYHHVRLEGRARTFVNRLPADVVCDLTDGSPMHVYMYCWIDSERGQGARVHYSPCDIAASPGTVGAEIQHHGEFDLALHVLDNDPDLLKIMACMRMKDQETKNSRTVTLAASAVQLDRLLMGEEQKLTMYSQFDPGNYTEVVIRASNAQEFANCASAKAAGQEHRPLVKLSRSSLWDMDVSDQAVNGVSAAIVEKIQKYLMSAPPGGEPFIAGLTRSPRRVACIKPLVFLSLFLGTPGYALTPMFTPQLGVRGGPVPVRRPSHQDAQDTLRSDELARRIPQETAANPVGGIPHLPAHPSLRDDRRGHLEARRCGLWSLFRTGAANHM